MKKVLFVAGLSLLVIPILLCFFSCRAEIDYFDYVSELRSNVFLAEDNELSLRVYAVKKESPYAADGIPQESAYRLEVYLLAPEGTKTVQLSLQAGKEKIEGEMSYDNVKGEYYYSRTADVSKEKELVCVIRYGETERVMTATSVLREDTLSPQKALQTLIDGNGELFSSLTDEYGFAGEIYLRLIYEDAPYYYIGVVERSGKISAFLMNAATGKILARRDK